MNITSDYYSFLTSSRSLHFPDNSRRFRIFDSCAAEPRQGADDLVFAQFFVLALIAFWASVFLVHIGASVSNLSAVLRRESSGAGLWTGYFAFF